MREARTAASSLGFREAALTFLNRPGGFRRRRSRRLGANLPAINCLGPLGIGYLLSAGGAGYFRMRAVQPREATPSSARNASVFVPYAPLNFFARGHLTNTLGKTQNGVGHRLLRDLMPKLPARETMSASFSERHIP
jgi:hypothetical protein